MTVRLTYNTAHSPVRGHEMPKKSANKRQKAYAMACLLDDVACSPVHRRFRFDGRMIKNYYSEIRLQARRAA